VIDELLDHRMHLKGEPERLVSNRVLNVLILLLSGRRIKLLLFRRQLKLRRSSSGDGSNCCSLNPITGGFVCELPPAVATAVAESPGTFFAGFDNATTSSANLKSFAFHAQPH